MPTIPEALALAVHHHNNGRFGDAEILYRKILEVEPKHADAIHLLGLLAYQTGNHSAAVSLITEAIGISGQWPVYHQHLALALQALGRRDEALSSARTALSLAPADGEVFNNLGNLFQDLGHMDEAMACRERALSVAPGNHLYRFNLGLTLEKFGRVEEAVVMYEEALRIHPDFPEGLNGLGELHRKAGRLDEAAACYQKALALRADFPDALNNLGLVYSSRGMLHEATAVFRRCLALIPRHDAALSNLGNVYQLQGDIEGAVDLFRRAAEVNPDLAVPRSNLIFALTHVHDVTGATLLHEALAWDRAQSRTVPAHFPSLTNTRDPERRLRIGFVSADFKDHAVSYFLLPLFRHFDRSSFELVCYNEVLSEDVVTGWFRESVDCWRDSRGIHDGGLADMCRADGIDILVDCSGHSGGNRLAAFKRRLAPVQVTTPLGHGGTTGVAEIDYFLSDAYLTPEGFDSQFSEKLIRLDRVFAPFEPKEFWPDPAPDVPDELLFGCFGDPVRISLKTIDLWKRLLDAAPGARVLFKNKAYGHPAMEQHWRARFAPLADRALFEGLPGGWFKNMDVYRRVRVMLDTFPSSGATSSLIPLWMGVPVLTRAGGHTLQRFGASILNNAGLGDLVAETDEAFLETGCALLADAPRLERLRRSLRPAMRASALCDAAGVTREWEAAFRRIWRHWCEEGRS